MAILKIDGSHSLSRHSCFIFGVFKHYFVTRRWIMSKCKHTWRWKSTLQHTAMLISSCIRIKRNKGNFILFDVKRPDTIRIEADSFNQFLDWLVQWNNIWPVWNHMLKLCEDDTHFYGLFVSHAIVFLPRGVHVLKTNSNDCSVWSGWTDLHLW